jgi:hypothetical protein
MGWATVGAELRSTSNEATSDVDRSFGLCGQFQSLLEGSSVAPLYALSFAKRPAEELYDMRADPDQLDNLADEAYYAEVKRRLAARLRQYLEETDDPRLRGQCDWHTYLYYGEGGNAPMR